MYDQGTVHIHVGSSFHMHKRPNTCTPCLPLEAVLVSWSILNFYSHFYVFISDVCVFNHHTKILSYSTNHTHKTHTHTHIFLYYSYIRPENGTGMQAISPNVLRTIEIESQLMALLPLPVVFYSYYYIPINNGQ